MARQRPRRKAQNSPILYSFRPIRPWAASAVSAFGGVPAVAKFQPIAALFVPHATAERASDSEPLEFEARSAPVSNTVRYTKNRYNVRWH